MANYPQMSLKTKPPMNRCLKKGEKVFKIAQIAPFSKFFCGEGVGGDGSMPPAFTSKASHLQHSPDCLIHVVSLIFVFRT